MLFDTTQLYLYKLCTRLHHYAIHSLVFIIMVSVPNYYVADKTKQIVSVAWILYTTSAVYFDLIADPQVLTDSAGRSSFLSSPQNWQQIRRLDPHFSVGPAIFLTYCRSALHFLSSISGFYTPKQPGVCLLYTSPSPRD